MARLISSRAQSESASPTVIIDGPNPWLHFGDDTRFRTVHVDLPVPHLPPALDGLRLVHLTDAHIRAHYPPLLEAIFPPVREFRPDLICFTGDWVENRWNHLPALPHVKRWIAQLAPVSRLGTFSVLGNHDGRLLAGKLNCESVTQLLHERVVIPVPNADAFVEIIGLSGQRPKPTTEHIVRSFPERPPHTARIVLCHYPYHIRLAEPILKPDLYLAGHTHGGQICLPGLPPLLTHDKLPKKYAAGLHRYGGTWLNVSRGLGGSHLQLRTFCPPEIHLFTLRCAAP